MEKLQDLNVHWHRDMFELVMKHGKNLKELTVRYLDKAESEAESCLKGFN